MHAENLAGSIKGFSVSSFIQLLELEQKTCTLHANFEGMKGCLHIKNGVVYDAETGNSRGEEAAILILGWDQAHINLGIDCAQKEKTIHSSLTRLILEASKRKDDATFSGCMDNDLEKAIRFAEGHNFKKAHHHVTTYLKADPKNVLAWLWYSRCLGKTKAISFALSKCYALDPDNPLVRTEIEKVEWALEQVGDAQVRRCPFCWTPLQLKSDHCFYCNANLVFSKALQANKTHPPNSKILIEAVTRYTGVVARENDNLKALYFLSLANCNLNKVEEALDLLNESIRTCPGNKFLSDQLNTIINHVAARVTKYENSPDRHNDHVLREKVPHKKNRNKILVVEDSPTTRKVIVLTLKQKGYRVIEARDGLEALGKINEERPDLILLDIILPKMDGYKILSILKENEDFMDIPVILLTSKDGIINKFKGKMAGSAAYLTKPFEPKTLIETVGKHIDMSRSADAD